MWHRDFILMFQIKSEKLQAQKGGKKGKKGKKGGAVGGGKKKIEVESVCTHLSLVFPMLSSLTSPSFIMLFMLYS